MRFSLRTPRRLIAAAALAALPLAACQQDAPHVLVPGTDPARSSAATAMDGETPVAPVVTMTDKVDGSCSALPSLSFRFSDADGPDDGPWAFTVDWGDGTKSTGTATPGGAVTVTRAEQYPDQGAYNAVVTVVDGRGLAGTTRTMLRFECNPPPAPANLSLVSGTCTSAASLAFDVTDGTADGPWSYTIAWGDGSEPTSGSISSLSERVSATHAYAENGRYAVTVTITERRGPTTAVTDTLTHDCNRPPAPTIVARSGGTCTTVPAFTFAVADADGAADGPWSYEVSWGDGSAPTTGTAALATNVLLSHDYAASGTYDVTVKVTDRRGLSGTASTELAFQCSRPPVPTITAAASGSCTAASSVTFSVADPDGAADGPWGYRITWGDGSTPTVGSAATLGEAVSESHAYAASGTYTVTVTVTDARGQAGATSKAVTYSCNRPPAVAVTEHVAASCTAGASMSFAVTDADGAVDGPWSWTISWGDGTTSSGSTTSLSSPVTASHAYLTNGSREVTITVTDRRGLTGTAATTLTRSCAAASCVAGPGFWKSRESAYPYPYAPTATWLRGGPAAPTWDAVVGQEKGGSTYHQLASQWAAATLNRARGAPVSATVLQVLDQAEAWLRARQNGNGSLPSLRDAQAERWKDTLDAYNDGRLGAPSCS